MHLELPRVTLATFGEHDGFAPKLAHVIRLKMAANCPICRVLDDLELSIPNAAKGVLVGHVVLNLL